LFLQHGPIDLIIELYGARAEIERALDQAIAGFDGLLDGLVGELPLLRQPLGPAYPMLRGEVAKAMVRAAWPLRDDFITPMAAVAGAVADHVLAAAITGRELEKGYVNNGGDIALYLSPGSSLSTGVVADMATGGLSGQVHLHHDLAVRGVATSGWRGRSHSRGIADAVTVLAATAAQADAAATMIANRVDIDHPGIERAAANSLDPDSDLGDLEVTVAVAELPEGARRAALLSGVDRARGLLDQGLIVGALLNVGDQAATVGHLGGEAVAHEGQKT
jgi:ApbE superfamily uncharacterized protein (UPF0280 family)